MKKTYIIIINIVIMVAILTFVVLYSGAESRNSYQRQIEHFEASTVTMEQVTENYLESEQGICDIWATYINKAEEDFRFISDLPGRKLLSRGNHDYWWTTMKKMEEFFAEKGFTDLEFIRTNVTEADGCQITGTRGWMIETKESLEGSDNRKIYEREKLRIGMCISELEKADPKHEKKHIMMIHYPPVTAKQDFTEFADLLAEGGVDICVYGHLHGKAHKKVFEGDFKGMELICASADYTEFKPVKIV